jgi:ribosomal protein L29
MLEQAADALDRQDYHTAAKLIAILSAERPDDLQVQLYAAQLQVATDRLDDALQGYRLVLQQAVNPKIIAEARKGIARIAQIQSQNQANELAIAQAGIEERIDPGFLILEPMSAHRKQETFKQLATIMNIDPYSARLQLPSRGWRLYRVGQMGQLAWLRDRLLKAEIPCFCVSQHDTQQVFVFQVKHLQSFHPQAAIVCTDARSELRTLNFDWSEVTQIVTGMLPIFEEVMEIDGRNRTRRKARILDYVQICDLQLRDRRTIFRLCAQTYDFCDYKQLITHNRHPLISEPRDRSSADLGGLLNGERIPTTSRDNWQNLISQISEQISENIAQSSFTPFAETAIGYPELLQRIDPHLELLRRADSLWDRAFHLYSSLAMCRDRDPANRF